MWARRYRCGGVGRAREYGFPYYVSVLLERREGNSPNPVYHVVLRLRQVLERFRVKLFAERACLELRVVIRKC